MTLQPVYMVCGVSGSGKTWVCDQLTDMYRYIKHDDHETHNGELQAKIVRAAKESSLPIITDCPFAERSLKADLERRGLDVYPVFVVEKQATVAARYLKREGKPIQKAAFTRAMTIKTRVKEWGSPSGTSDQVLAMLKARPPMHLRR